MHFQTFLLFGVLIMWERVQGAPCNCGLGSGVDYCVSGGQIGGGGGTIGIGPISGGGSSGGSGGSSGGSGGIPPCPLVVRPQELPIIDIGTISKPRVVCQKIDDIIPLKPIGSLCSCGQTIVKPAYVPAPSCGYCSGSGSSQIAGSSSSSSQSSSSSSSTNQVISQTAGGSISINFPACGPPVINQARPQVPQTPADAVSLDLAYRQQQQQKNDKAERRIAYGFERLPAETPCAKKSATFREGNYQIINGKVLELPVARPKQEEEEYEEYIEEEEPETIEIVAPTFGDLGYRLSNPQSGKFINVVSDAPQVSCGSGDDIVSTCNDGYRRGEVIIADGQVNSGIPPQQQINPCAQASSNAEFYEVPSYATYSQSSSSSSASNNAQSQIYLESCA